MKKGSTSVKNFLRVHLELISIRKPYPNWWLQLRLLLRVLLRMYYTSMHENAEHSLNDANIFNSQKLIDS